MEWIVLEPRKGKRPDYMARVTMAWRKTSGRSGEALTACFNVAKAIAAELGWPEKAWLELSHDPSGTMLRARLAEGGYRVSKTNGCASFQASMHWIRSEARKAEPVEHKVLDGGVLLITLPAWARMPEERRKRDVESGPEAQASSPAEPAASEPPKKWTDERKAKLRELYLARTPTAEIAAALNAMPGLEIKVSDVGSYAIAAMRLPTLAALEEAATGSKPVGLTPSRSKVIGGAPTDKDAAKPTPRDEVECKAELRKGRNVRELADEFGFKFAVIQRWQDEVRAERGRAA